MNTTIETTELFKELNLKDFSLLPKNEALALVDKILKVKGLSIVPRITLDIQESPVEESVLDEPVSE